MKRECGDCTVCCDILTIEEENFYKEGRTKCNFLVNNKCNIYEDKPKCCSEFFCSWLTGIGGGEQQPNKNKILTFAAEFNNGLWVAVIETEPDALLTSGREMAIELAKLYSVPLVVELYNNKNKTGDWTVIKESLFSRTSKMRGSFIQWLDEENTVGVYELINSNEDF